MKRRRTSAAVALAMDHGPMIRRARGEVVVEDRPDPDRPGGVAVRGASLYDPIKRLVASGTLDMAHLLAAERFRNDHGLAEGAREAAVGGTPSWSRGYAARQIQAVTDRRLALQAVGIRLGAIFVATVLEQLTIREAERTLHIRSGNGSGLVLEAMTRLVEHYGQMDGPGSRA